MTINEMLRQGVCLQGMRRVIDNLHGEEKGLYEGEDEWGWGTLDEEWADWEINYIYPMCGEIIIELDNPEF